ncbi:MAG: hypothetical protein B7Z73_10010 [Planctomycetia bacterium 21-64-5]|nr:MAG: hypothetical protein B7Z73_10010 [Planctomycetia bacterium 21-64-5]
MAPTLSLDGPDQQTGAVWVELCDGVPCLRSRAGQVASSLRVNGHAVTTARLHDGDQIVLHDDCPEGWQPGDRVALLIHGLAGCHQSIYMLRIAARLEELGVRAFRMDLRGCGAGVGLARLPYHAGRSEDAAAALETIARLCPASPVALVGFSMGGNIALKLLGELGEERCGHLDRAVAVCPPFDLLAGANIVAGSGLTGHLLQPRRNRVGVGEPRARILDHHIADQLHKLLAQRGVEQPWVPRQGVKMPVQLGPQRRSRKRNFAGHRVVQRATQGIQVGRGRKRARLLNLLRRKKVGGASGGLAVGVCRRRVAEEAGQTQVGKLDLVFRRHQQVARLHVAMRQAAAMRVGQSLGRLSDESGGTPHGKLPLSAHQLSQIGAGHKFHHQKVNVAMVARIEGAHQVFVVQLPLRADLRVELFDRLGRCSSPRQNLDGHNAAHQRMLGHIDVAGAPLAERIDDAIRAESERAPSGGQLCRLPRVQPPHGDELDGQIVIGEGLPRGRFSSSQYLPGLLQVVLRHQTAGHRAALKG